MLLNPQFPAELWRHGQQGCLRLRAGADGGGQSDVASGFAGSASSGRASHTFTVPSPPAEAIRWPSGLNATLAMGLVCPSRARDPCPDRASHTLTVLSPPAEAIRWPSGLNATL